MSTSEVFLVAMLIIFSVASTMLTMPVVAPKLARMREIVARST